MTDTADVLKSNLPRGELILRLQLSEAVAHITLCCCGLPRGQQFGRLPLDGGGEGRRVKVTVDTAAFQPGVSDGAAH